ncbi:MAG: SRPBCC family protein [Bacteroidia bacterium]
MPKIKIETEINAPIKIVFDLSRSIDLHKISTKQTNEEAIAGVTSGLMGEKQSVTWRAKHFGVYQSLTSKITEFKMPDYFVDEMEKGIFKRFRHEHIFKEVEGKTLMIDIFDYQSPLGILGKIADKLFLEKYMKSLLETRNETIKEFAESDKWRKVLN